MQNGYQILKRIFCFAICSFFQNDSKSEKSEEERDNEELLKIDLMFRRIELRDMDLQYDLFDEKLKDLERWYTKK